MNRSEARSFRDSDANPRKSRRNQTNQTPLQKKKEIALENERGIWRIIWVIHKSWKNWTSTQKTSTTHLQSATGFSLITKAKRSSQCCITRGRWLSYRDRWTWLRWGWSMWSLKWSEIWTKPSFWPTTVSALQFGWESWRKVLKDATHLPILRRVRVKVKIERIQTTTSTGDDES